MDILTITQFSEKIKDFIPNKKYTLTGEVNQPKNSHGHIYFTLKDNTNCLNSTIWKSKAETIKANIKEGDKITTEGKLDYYGPAGKLNFIVDKIITNEGIGDLQKKYDKIKSDFEKKGYFDKNRKKLLSSIIKNILVLTSETGAAYFDFLYGLENSHSKVNVNLIDVIVQGIDCPKNICIELDKLKNNNKQYDLVVITRGGGSFQDLFGFSQPELIETLYNFHLPTLSAIGHQVDNPLSDLICDYSAPTPSLAAQFIVDYNKSYVKQFQKKNNEIKNTMTIYLINELDKYNKLLDKVNKKTGEFEKKYKQILINELNEHLRKLNQLESKLNIYENKNIILNGDGQLISKSSQLENYDGKYIEIIWNGVIVKTKVLSIDKIN